MKRVAMLLFIAIVVSPVNSWSQHYQYNDKNGVVLFADNSGNIPEEEKKTVKTRSNEQTNASDHKEKDAAVGGTAPLADDKCRVNLEDNLLNCRSLFKTVESLKPSQVVFMVSFCGHPLLRDMLTAQEKELLSKMSVQAEKEKKGLTRKELNEIGLGTKYFYAPCQKEEEKKYSKQELDALDKALKDIWRKMSEALVQNDIETAVNYHSETHQDSWRQHFQNFTPEARAQFARESLEAQLHLDNVLGNRVIYHLITTRNGDRYSFQLTFVKNSWGEWKILSY